MLARVRVETGRPWRKTCAGGSSSARESDETAMSLKLLLCPPITENVPDQEDVESVYGEQLDVVMVDDEVS